jgi:hypothetical protein
MQLSSADCYKISNCLLREIQRISKATCYWIVKRDRSALYMTMRSRQRLAAEIDGLLHYMRKKCRKTCLILDDKCMIMLSKVIVF